MLLISPRHTEADLVAWAEREAEDVLWPRERLALREARAVHALGAFIEAGPAYLGVSWGKDSTVVADLVMRHYPETPMVYAVIEPLVNPDCALVRDAFLARWPDADYTEVAVQCERDPMQPSGWNAGSTLWSAMRHWCAEAGEEYEAGRYITGIRAEESSGRARRCEAFGQNTARTSAPLAAWAAGDVYAYLHRRGLPVHPAYACSYGGALDRGRIRVGELGLTQGTGFGRGEWEERYYAAELAAIRKESRDGGSGSAEARGDEAHGDQGPERGGKAAREEAGQVT